MYWDILGHQNCESTAVTSGEEAAMEWPSIVWPHMDSVVVFKSWSERKHS